MDSCVFCRIAKNSESSLILWESPEVIAFLEVRPARPGHCLIIPRQHFETFDDLPLDLATKIMEVGQRIARRMKEVYSVRRVAFVYTGGEVAHAHAHVLPMHNENDIIFAADVTNPASLQFDSSALEAPLETLVPTQKLLELTDTN